jgi:hypothetical protein
MEGILKIFLMYIDNSQRLLKSKNNRYFMLKPMYSVGLNNLPKPFTMPYWKEGDYFALSMTI